MSWMIDVHVYNGEEWTSELLVVNFANQRFIMKGSGTYSNGGAVSLRPKG